MLPSLELMVEQFWSYCVISDEGKTLLPEVETDWGEKESAKPPYKPWAAEIDTAMIGLDCISNTFSLAKKKNSKNKKSLECNHVRWEIALGCHFFLLWVALGTRSAVTLSVS